MLFASTLNSSVMLGNYLQLFAADDFSRRHFQMHFFLALFGLKKDVSGALYNMNCIALQNVYILLGIRVLCVIGKKSIVGWT